MHESVPFEDLFSIIFSGFENHVCRTSKQKNKLNSANLKLFTTLYKNPDES